MYKKGFGTNISPRWQKPFITLVSCQVYILPCTHKGFLLGYFFILVSKGSLHILLRKISYKEQPTYCQNYFIFHVEQKPNFISFHLLVFFSFCSLKFLTVTTRSKEKSSLGKRFAIFLLPTFSNDICKRNLYGKFQSNKSLEHA